MQRSGVSAMPAAVEVRAEHDAVLVDLRRAASDITWKPPESVRIGPGQAMKRCRPPRRATRSAPGPQHQVVGVGEHDLGAGRAQHVGASSP